MNGQHLWYMGNFFSITAGDYDDDHIDSVIVYYCLGTSAYVTECTWGDSGIVKRTSLSIADNDM